MLQLNENYSNSNSVAVLGTASPSDMGQIFSYNGNSVRMRKMNGYIFVCLTDFAKPFPDKNLSHIVNSKELTDYVARMSEIQNCSSADLLQVTKGGDVSQQGTWADQYEKNQTLALEVEKKEQEKQSIIEETKPAVVFTECVTSSSTNILIGDLAKLITQNGYKIGEIRLYEWMVENKFLIRRQRYSKSKNKYVNDYMPTQRAAEMGLSFVKERPIVSGGSPIFIKHTCYVTGKGQVYFLNKFKSLMAA